ncbi:DUF1330 domain-containing protein [Paeniroseomonas aquatica]
MSAYLIANITVTDPTGFAAYRDRVAPMIAAHGGRYLVRGGAVTPVEGEPGAGPGGGAGIPRHGAARGLLPRPRLCPADRHAAGGDGLEGGAGRGGLTGDRSRRSIP